MDTILSKLRNRSLFSSTEYQIAQFIYNNPEEAIHMSVREIASKTYTNPTSVMRVCKKLCEEGFGQFRIELAKEISFTQTSDLTSQEAMSQKLDNIDEIMQQLKTSVIQSIEFTQKLISKECIKKIVELLNIAATIDVYGRGSSNDVGKDFRYKMYRLGYSIHLFENIDLQAIQAFNSDSTHVAIILSSSGETPEILNFAKILNQKRTPVITITGSQDCSLLKYSDYPLFFQCFESNQRVGGITSRSAMQYILDVIYFSVLNADYEKHSQKILSNYVPKNIGTY